MASLPKELVAAIARRQVMVIAGAGLSISASGKRPEASWPGLLRSGLQLLQADASASSWARFELSRLSKADVDALSLSYIADQLRERLDAGTTGESAFNRWIIEAIGRVDEGYASSDDRDLAFLESVINLACPIATTNYDHILESHTGFETVTPSTEEKVAAFIRGAGGMILHLHGEPSVPGSLVLGRKSYQEYVGSLVKTEMQRALSTVHSCLFVGFGEGLNDLNFTPWFRWISDTLRQSSIKHYVLLNAEQAKKWEEANHGNISAVVYGKQHAELPLFLVNLKQAAEALLVEGSTKPRPKRASVPGMADQLLYEKITAVRDGKDVIGAAIHRFLVEKLVDNAVPIYSSKHRLKTVHSIWNKVQDDLKRQTEKDPLELVDAVRDIVGIRIVTLYRLDLKRVVRDVAEWFLPSTATATPFGARLIRAKIFGVQTDSKGSDGSMSISAFIEKFLSDNNVPIERASVPVATSYSAFHLVCGYVGDDGRHSTFEIQLRSALEDIWSEMEHGLRYKPMDKGVQRAVREAEDLQIAREHFASLKSLIDGSTRYADTIRRHLDRLAPVNIGRLSIHTLDRTERLNELLVGPDTRWFRDRFSGLFRRQSIALGQVHDANTPPLDPRAEASDALLQLAEEFHALAEAVGTIPLSKGSNRPEVFVIVAMEEALCLLEGAIRHPMRSERAVGLRPALAAYARIQAILERPSARSWSLTYDAMALHRLARLRVHMKMIEDAVALSKRAYGIVIEMLERQPLLRLNGRSMIEIALLYVWAMQDYAEDLAVRAADMGEPYWKVDDRLALYSTIVDVSLNSRAKLGENVADFVNFALFAAAEFVSLGGHKEDLIALGEEQQADLLDRLDIPAVLAGRDTNTVHTAFRVAEHLVGDLDLAERAARRLEFLISEEPSPDVYQERDLQQVRDWLAEKNPKTDL